MESAHSSTAFISIAHNVLLLFHEPYIAVEGGDAQFCCKARLQNGAFCTRMHAKITLRGHHLPHLPHIFHEIRYDLYAAVEDGRCGRCFSVTIPKTGVEEDEDGEQLQAS